MLSKSIPLSATPPQVLMLDSGIGGLTIARAVQDLLPQVQITYIADSSAFPYGEREIDDLIARTTHLIDWAMQTQTYQAVVIACNTASTVVLDPLRAQWQLPIVGVVPAIKPAAENTMTGCFGLLATEGTVKRAYIDSLITRFAPQCRVIKVGSPDLARIAEEKIRGKQSDLAVIQHNLSAFLEHPDLDTIVLGCTHYPFLKHEIHSLLPDHVRLIEPSQAIARRLAHQLNLPTTLTPDLPPLKHRFISTGTTSLKELYPFLKKLNFETIGNRII